jgi:hypothetical protein
MDDDNAVLVIGHHDPGVEFDLGIVVRDLQPATLGDLADGIIFEE